MTPSCLVIDCKSGYKDTKFVSFFRLPTARRLKSEKLSQVLIERRQKWLRVLKRELTENQLKSGRVCSKHFISGKPAEFYAIHHPDWVPNQNMGYSVGVSLKKPSALQRYERTKKREYKKMNILLEKSLQPIVKEEVWIDDLELSPNENETEINFCFASC